MVNGLQIISNLPKFNLLVPANVIAFYDWVNNLSNFDILPTDTIIAFITGTDENTIFEKLGMMFLTLLGIAACYVFVLILKFVNKRHPRLKIIYDKLVHFLFWNGTLRFIIEGYLNGSLESLA